MIKLKGEGCPVVPQAVGISPGQCIALQCKILPRIQGEGGSHCTTVVWDGMPCGTTGHLYKRVTRLRKSQTCYMFQPSTCTCTLNTMVFFSGIIE